MAFEHLTVERVARESYGRLLAFLTARNGDWAASEDALSEAFKSALETWPSQGVPANPEAWLLVVARRRLCDLHRRNARYVDTDLTRLSYDGGQACGELIPDQRLCMLFLCVHPAIDAALQTPLMLQAVFGLSAERIASAFLVRPTTMGQRLSRAKAKIRQAGIRLAVPEGAELRSRLGAVLEAIYAAYGKGWDTVAASDSQRQGLASEAIFLGRLIVDLLPSEAEAHGLLSLMLYCESRASARRTSSGIYVPLGEQDVSLWHKDFMREAEQHLADASAMGKPGRFQLEAAIQSAHAFRLITGSTDRTILVELYQGLLAFCPTIGVRVSHIAAVSEADGADKGLELLHKMPCDQVAGYQPYWALRGYLEMQMGNREEAAAAYGRAMGLTEDNSVRRYLMKKIQDCAICAKSNLNSK